MSGVMDKVISLWKGAPPNATALAEMAKEKALGEFMEAARGHDVPRIERLLADRRLSLDDEVGRGRGLLQFAVMVNSVKTASYLRQLGADPDSEDSLGASAAHLAKKHSEPMRRAIARAA